MHNSIYDFNYLILDIQASNPDPEKGSVLEIGWSEFTVNRSPGQNSTYSQVVRPQSEVEIPKRILRITGLTEKQLDSGKPLSSVWNDLFNQVKNIQKVNKNEFCPTIIHFSRYEKPFLDFLITTFSPLKNSPFSILCTHQISQHLWPELPRKGLRAVAGFLGWSVEESRRSNLHIDATAWIWRHCLEKFKEKEINTWEAINQFIDQPIKKATKERAYPMDPEKRKNLPKGPGVYHMFRSNGDLLYVGKATSLKQRVSSYFRKNSKHAEHILEMLSQAADLVVTQTHSALEACLLETDDIKHLNPPYNRALKLKERQLVFLDKGFNHIEPLVEQQTQIGPLPDNDLYPFIIFLNNFLNQPGELVPDDILNFSIFGNDIKDVPDVALFKEGVFLIKQKYKDLMNVEPSIHNLIRYGGRLRKIKKDAEAEALDVLEDESELLEEIEILEVAEEEWQWTSEAVNDRIEGVLRFVHKLIARSNWYVRLANATISWRKNQRKSSNILILKDAVILNSYQILQSKKHKIIPHKKLPIQLIKRNFDIADYDRMRVLTTEIKRLAKKDREPCVYFNATCILTDDRLAHILQWV